jgi:AraC family transcriptional regulator of adaptative response/methylated-DNA-[protein]-cysteine methyltransferase
VTDYQRIEKVIRHIDRHYHDQPTLAQLARVAGLSEFHFHRLFHRWAGTTPKNFIQFLTATHAKNLLRESHDVMGAALKAGLSDPNRLHDLMISIDALTPSEYKRDGESVEIRYGIHETPFGPGLLSITPRGICHLSLGSVEDPERELRARWPRATFVADARSTARAMSGIFAANMPRAEAP